MKKAKNIKKDKIIEFFFKNHTAGSSDVFSYLISEKIPTSLVTVKRDLSELVSGGILKKTPKGPETFYELSTYGRFFVPINAHEYVNLSLDKRYGQESYNFSLFEDVPDELFSEEEIKKLDEATKNYKLKSQDTSPTIIKKELERFVIELSWKSSKIEGNTYTLLDTERLIRDGIEAPGHTKDEATMILNHKSAFDFIHSNKDRFKKIDRVVIEQLHSLLVAGLDVNSGYRKGMVGITGSKYRPLDNEYQIHEAMENLFKAMNRMKSIYSKSLLALLGISYIQAFEDGNKRTSRLTANAVLMANGASPLSYRSVDEIAYRETVLVFYELNSIFPFKDIFISQYLFAADNYLVR